MAEKKAWGKTNQWAEELELLKSIINKTILVETIKWGTPVYTHINKNIIGVGSFKSYFGIWFFNGVFLNLRNLRTTSVNNLRIMISMT